MKLLHVVSVLFSLFLFSNVAVAENSSLVVIDPSVPNYETLMLDLPADTEALLLNRNDDALQRIIARLQNSPSVEKLHLFTHASSGLLSMADRDYSELDLIAQKNSLAAIGALLGEQGEINLYGCELAAGTEGRSFVNTLASLTNTKVAASTNLSGAKSLGGDWNLEYRTAEFQSQNLLSANFEKSYNYVLSHFRGGGISWQTTELDGDGEVNDVVITVKTAWRYNSISSVSLGSSPSLSMTQQSNVIDYINGDASSADYALQTTIITAKDLDPDTVYSINYSSCCRISSLQNNSGGNWDIQTDINIKAGNLSPKIDLPIIYEVPQFQSDGVTVLEDYSFQVASTDPNADKIRFRLANLNELGGGSSVHPTGFSINTNTGVVTWTNSGNLTAGVYSSGIVVEDVDANGAVISKSHFDFLLDLQPKSAIAFTPSTNIPDSRNIIVEKGDTFDFDITGVAVDVSSLGNIQGALTEPTEGNFTFDPGAVGAGLDPGTYPITFEIYDTSGGSTKSYLILNFIVPDPKAPKIDNIEADSSVYSGTENLLVDVDLDAAVTDLDAAGAPVSHLDNGFIRFNVTFTDGQYEILDIKSDGDAAGQIRRTGSEVFYEGIKIGDIDAFEDGVGQALRVDFGTASLASVQALVRNLTYTDTFLLRSQGQRNLSLFIQDEDGLNRNYSVYVDVQDHPEKPISGGPAQVNNKLSIEDGETVSISSDEINFVDADTSAAGLTITADTVTNGQFEYSSNPSIAITSFTQQDVNNGLVIFVHSGSGSAPSYNLTVSDGTSSVGPNAAAISFTATSADFVSLPENRIGVTAIPSSGVVGTPSYAITGGIDAALFNISTSSGSLSFIAAADYENPSDADTDNVYEVEVTVTGSTSGTDVRTVSVAVLDVNELPGISGSPTTTVAEGSAYSFTPTASDPEMSTLTFSVSNKPTWAVFNTATGELSGTPSYTSNGTYSNIIVTVSDGSGSASLAPFEVVVSDVNGSPTISGAPTTSLAEAESYSFTPTASDPETDTLSFNISNKPAWATFDTGTGELSGTPDYSSAGTYSTIVISVSDGNSSASLPAFAINVSNVNRTPTIGGSPSSTAMETTAYSFVPTSSDPDGDTLTFSIANKPSWATFNTTTGAVTGTPGYSDAGSYSNIIVSVSDGGLSAALPAFAITVSDTNRAPSIGGTPASSATEASSYSFVPSSNDADGDTLTFSITNKPAWANFDTGTGTLAGVPATSDVGLYSNIAISVSDGRGGSANLSAFSINVSALNLAPTATAQSLQAVENRPLALVLSGSDPDDDELTFTVLSSPTNGSISGTAPNLTYTPAANFTGSDSFSFSVSDAFISSSPAVISLEVQADLDGDGLPDVTDTDDDGDGLSDTEEGDGDSDGDGIIDSRDSSDDEDGDGVPDILENLDDDDNDGIPNAFDPDSDNDGMTDGAEAPLSGTDSDNDGIDDAFDVDATGGNDSNGDGIDDDIGLRDSDNNGKPDAYDPDADGDGIPDTIEGRKGMPDSDDDGIPDAYDADQTGGTDSDEDGVDDRYDIDSTGGRDADGDGINDLAKVPDQDNDGLPDYLDEDSDNDGLSDGVEAGASGSDSDGDGIDDAYDADNTGGFDLNEDGVDDEVVAEDSDGDGIPNYQDLDSDNDGIFDVTEAGLLDNDGDALVDDGTVLTTAADSDSDGTPDYLDLDSDNDGTFDIEGTAAKVLDTDQDGRIDLSADVDGDGIDDSLDAQLALPGVAADSDGDGVTAALDKDQDGDGISDNMEGTGDSDDDGIPDALDRDSDNDGLPDRFEMNRPIPSGMDSDLDGIDDAYDVDATGGLDANADGIDDSFTTIDTDGDGIADYLDSDSDNDGVPDAIEQLLTGLSGLDSDSDGIDDAIDVDTTGGTDANGDGVDDAMIKSIDTDGDGIPDFRDTDSDGDGFADSLENGDFNGDGIDDRLQVDEGVTTGVSGGGSSNLFMTLLLAFALAWRFRRARAFAVLCALLLSASASADSCQPAKSFTSPTCWYLGGGFGFSDLQPEPGTTTWYVDDGKNSKAYQLLVGVDLNNHWSIEASYADLGVAKLANLNPNIRQRPEISYSILGLSATYTQAIYRDWKAVLKAGVQQLQTENIPYQNQDHGQQLTFGFGVEKDFTSVWHGRLAWEYYDTDATALFLTVTRQLRK